MAEKRKRTWTRRDGSRVTVCTRDGFTTRTIEFADGYVSETYALLKPISTDAVDRYQRAQRKTEAR
jgi:hypothetical protein